MKVCGVMILILSTFVNIYGGSIKSCLSIPTAKDYIRVTGTMEIKGREIEFTADKDVFRLFNIDNVEKKRKIRINFVDIRYIIVNDREKEIYISPDKKSRFFKNYRHIHTLIYTYVTFYMFELDFALCIETDIKRFRQVVKRYIRSINRDKIFLE